MEKIQHGETVASREGMEQLYGALSAGVRPALARTVEHQSVEDRLHEVLVIVIEAIYRGEVREPERLLGFIKTVARRRAIAHIRSAAFERRRFVTVEVSDPFAPTDQDPERTTARREKLARMHKVLHALHSRDREILERFYFKEEPAAQICREMRLTATQFRLFKSRAIARCVHLVHA